jgi:hypothetical protein
MTKPITVRDRAGRTLRVIAAVCLLALPSALLFAAPARGAGIDTAVTQAVAKILSDDVANANFGVAKQKLARFAAQCDKGRCEPKTRAVIAVAQGVVAAQIGKPDEAQAFFLAALKLDPTATLPASGVTPAAQASFDQAKKLAPPPPPPPAASSASAAASSLPPGWTNKDAWESYKLAQTAETAGLWDTCIEKDKAALALEDQPIVRLHLATCEQGAHKILDALSEAQRALEAGITRRDLAVTKAAKSLVEALLKQVAHVSFVPPPGVQKLSITFDGKDVPLEGAANRQFAVDPGKHAIHADGAVAEVPVAFDETVTVSDGESKTVEIALKPKSSGFLTPGQEACMREAHTQEEVLKCLPSNKKPLRVLVGTDVGAYADTTAVRVLSPSIHADVSSPTAGWHAGATYLIDIVSAASPDIVSTASRAFHDTRHAVTVGGGYKPSRFGADVTGNYSIENDYRSIGAHATGKGEFNDKLVTPAIGIGRREDTIGRAGTPFDVFSTHLSVTEIDASSTFVLNASSLLAIGASLDIERGDQSKPYRLIPMFDPSVSVPVGASVASVNAARLPVRPLEQLPLERDRWALSGRWVKRIGGTSTIRLEERLYRDTWQIYASTTDLRWLIDVSKRLMLGPHARAHVQSGANFYHRIYHAEIAPALVLPIFRTTDRELSPFIAATGGGTARFELSRAESTVRFALLWNGDVMYSHYLDALYIRNRLAVYGTLGVEGVFE